MYSVPRIFHELAIQDAPITRCRIYFFDDTVDCTDDNDVQTNGTLLVGAAGDTDSNGRIGQDGILFEQFFNKEKNIIIGDCLSNQIEMTLLNNDGALDNFAWGRCKVYLDVYDAANSTWIPCPMGVYIIEEPMQTKLKLVTVHGFDEMQKLDAIADSWWNSIDWTNGLNCFDILTSMATSLGLAAFAPESAANQRITYTSAPFNCVQMTYKDVLGKIAEFSGANAFMDRDGKISIKAITPPFIVYPDPPYLRTFVIDTDTIGNQCLEINIGSYIVKHISSVALYNAGSQPGTTSGSGDPQYDIFDNLLFEKGIDSTSPGSDSVAHRVWEVLQALQAARDYPPINGKFIWDWSLDAGDLIQIKRGGETIDFPIFQQTMLWRGGFVVATALSDGDKVRPVSSEKSREAYQAGVALSDKVGINEVVSALNNTTESVDILRNVIVNSLNGVKLSITDIPGGSSATFDMPNADKSLFVVIGASANNKCLLLANTSTAGSVTVTQTPTAGNITYTTATRKLTIASASLASRVLRIQF